MRGFLLLTTLSALGALSSACLTRSLWGAVDDARVPEHSDSYPLTRIAYVPADSKRPERLVLELPRDATGRARGWLCLNPRESAPLVRPLLESVDRIALEAMVEIEGGEAATSADLTLSRELAGPDRLLPGVPAGLPGGRVWHENAGDPPWSVLTRRPWLRWAGVPRPRAIEGCEVLGWLREGRPCAEAAVADLARAFGGADLGSLDRVEIVVRFRRRDAEDVVLGLDAPALWAAAHDALVVDSEGRCRSVLRSHWRVTRFVGAIPEGEIRGLPAPEASVLRFRFVDPEPNVALAMLLTPVTASLDVLVGFIAASGEEFAGGLLEAAADDVTDGLLDALFDCR